MWFEDSGSTSVRTVGLSKGDSLHAFASRGLPVAQLRKDDALKGRKRHTIVLGRRKRAFDISFALTFLLVLAPAVVLIAVLIKSTSRGQVFFRQKRHGIDGELFEIWKFRTMYADLGDQRGVLQTRDNDPRITPFGRFLRRTSLDDLPQMINVLKGDMGFVGPRPERPEFVPMLAEQLPFYNLRHLIRPGLTGWAQVRYGYGATLAETKEKLEYDLYYIKHMSLGLDLLIMFETIKIILRRRGAQ